MHDIAIIGCGPVGALAANLLGQAGLDVVVLEKESHPYPLPRAVHLDHEMMRFFQSADVIDRLLPDLKDTEGHLHIGADGGVIRYMGTVGQERPYGWSNDYFFYQPELEDHLRNALTRFGNVTVKLGCEFRGLHQTDDAVALDTVENGAQHTIKARWVIACDGARSLVRKTLNITLDDLNFDEPWLVVDAEVEGPIQFPNIEGLPAEADIQKLSVMMCDPKRPATVVPGRGNHRRWELMLLPGEDDQEMMSPDVVQGLIAPYVEGVQHNIIRAATYHFHGLIAKQWRQQRVFLAGDAAHQTPPFFGQGMCHGFRDVANLAWKLPLVINKSAPEALLDTYQTERDPHVRKVIATAVDTGRYICLLDENEAKARDHSIRERARNGELAATGAQIIPALDAGVVSLNSPGAGERFIQPTLNNDTLLDDLTGGGWRLFVNHSARETPCHQLLTRACPDLNIKVIDASELSSSAIIEWLSQRQADCVLIRPDHYVFGTAQHGSEHRLLETLQSQLMEAQA